MIVILLECNNDEADSVSMTNLDIQTYKIHKDKLLKKITTLVKVSEPLIEDLEFTQVF